jgi:Anti-sigma-K factor rskA, C-terminal
MDHDAARERLELAALEPGGLERLMAGDTASAQAVAAHLAGCPSCTEELARLDRASTLIRDVVREMPPPDLRARMLVAIRAEGVMRPLAAGAGATTSTTIGAPLVAEGAPIPIDRRRRAPVLGWIVTVAAAVVLSIVSTSILVGGRVDGQLATQAETISALEEVTTATLTLTAQPDAQHVAMAGVSDPSLTGSIAFSPSTQQLVVVATGLTSPTAGQEYRCWLEVGGTRQSLGKMHFSEDLAYWIGPAPAVSGISSGATFGVSLVGVSGGSVEAAPVLVGQL